MNPHDETYKALVQRILTEGERREDRTGTGTLSVFGHQMRFDLRAGFPLLTTKRVHFKSIREELLWFLRGDTNVKWLNDHGVTIWDEWADEDGNLGPVYGKQWRSWEASDEDSLQGLVTIDQIEQVIESIQIDPFSRRHIVSAWNPADLPDMALPPCHMMFQFYVHADENGDPERLSCHLYQRSGDVFLGVPFNIASYALLTHLIADRSGLEVDSLVHTIGDAHLYLNHIEQATEQISRTPLTAPRLWTNGGVQSIDGYTPEDILITGYVSHPPIKAPVAV